jgi:nicotinamidase-related amidase
MTSEANSLNHIPVPAKTFLLAMDFQVAILRRIDDAGQLLARMASVIDAARAAGIGIGYVRVALEDADYDRIPGTNMSFTALASGRMLHSASPDSAIHELITPRPDDLVVRKIRTGAFSTTDLHQQLQQRGIDTLILAGIATGGVVLSTLRDAADRDYRIFVLSDCCRDMDPLVHDVLMTKVFPRQAIVTTSGELFGHHREKPKGMK